MKYLGIKEYRELQIKLEPAPYALGYLWNGPDRPSRIEEKNQMRKYFMLRKYVLDTLSKKEAEVFSKYYGLDDNKYMTLKEVAETMGTGPANVGKILSKTLRKLMHPARSLYFPCLLDGDFEYDKTQPLTKEILKNAVIEKMKREGYRIPPEQEDMPPFHNLTKASIDKINFSYRTREILLRNGKNTIKDVITMTKEEYKNIKNIGDVTLKEIREKLCSWGLDIRPDNMGKAEWLEQVKEEYNTKKSSLSKK